jgi:MYXO-CTERM domain-containing protein
MIFPSCKRTVLAVMVLLTAIVAVMSPPVVLAQAPPGTPAPGTTPGQRVEPPATRTETRDDGSGKWGLLGLLGLAGLAGLLRRDRTRPLDRTDRPGRP